MTDNEPATDRPIPATAAERVAIANRYRALFGDRIAAQQVLSAEVIRTAFARLNKRLHVVQMRATINLVGGAVMTLVHQIRPHTDDVDGWIAPDNFIQSHVLAVGRSIGCEHWLNEQALMYFPDRSASKGVWIPFLVLSNLTVQTADEATLFAMKALALRHQTDRHDVQYLAEILGIRTYQQALAVVRDFYRDTSITAAALVALREQFHA